MIAEELARADHQSRKPKLFTGMSQQDHEFFDELTRISREEAQPRRDIVREGQKSEHVRLVLSGWACRYKDLPDGRRQIVGFLLPGDFCNLNVYILEGMDHSIGALTRVTGALIDPADMERVISERPQIARALVRHELVAASIQREWLLNVGQRSAYERLAHLLCELFLRLREVGLTDGNSCDFPITQTDIADAAGITSIHVNRILQDLRGDGLIELASRRLGVPDLGKLMAAGLFDPNYLHLDREGRHLDTNG